MEGGKYTGPFKPFTKKGMEKAEKRAKRVPMNHITISLPEVYDKGIQKLIDMKIINSRSEAIRTALRDFIREEISFNNKLNNGGLVHDQGKDSKKDN